MKAFHFLFRFYIQSSIHLSLALACLVFISYNYLKIAPDLPLVFFVFFGSICGYNFIKYQDVLKGKEKQISNTVKIIAGFTILSILFTGYFLLQLSFWTQFAALLCGVLTFFYSFTFSPNGKNLRNIYGGKIFIIALVCTVVTLVLPVLQSNQTLDGRFLFYFLQRFLFILVVLLPFEIRDVTNDAVSLGTIPQKVGVKNTKILGLVFLVLFVLLSIWLYEGIWVNIWSDTGIAIIAALFLVFSKVKQQMYYASFWVEAIPIFWLGLWILLIRGF